MPLYVVGFLGRKEWVPTFATFQFETAVELRASLADGGARSLPTCVRAFASESEARNEFFLPEGNDRY